MSSTPSRSDFNLLDRTIACVLGMWDGLLKNAFSVEAASKSPGLQQELEEPVNYESNDSTITYQYHGSFLGASRMKLRNDAQLKTRKIAEALSKLESICQALQKLADQIRYKPFLGQTNNLHDRSLFNFCESLSLSAFLYGNLVHELRSYFVHLL